MALPVFAEGRHVRTGMEEPVFLREGELARSKEVLVGQWVDTARIWRRPMATQAQGREMLSVTQGTKQPQ